MREKGRALQLPYCQKAEDTRVVRRELVALGIEVSLGKSQGTPSLPPCICPPKSVLILLIYSGANKTVNTQTVKEIKRISAILYLVKQLYI